jgi:hypothetical protein
MQPLFDCDVFPPSDHLSSIDPPPLRVTRPRRVGDRVRMCTEGCDSSRRARGVGVVANGQSNLSRAICRTVDRRSSG